MKKLLLVLPLALFALGCSDPYGASVKAGNTISVGIHNAMTTIDTYRITGLMSPNEEISVLGYLKFANDADTAFLDCAATAHLAGNHPGTYTACAQAFESTLNTPSELALIRVNNLDVQSAVDVIVQGIITGINSTITALGGA